MRPATPADAPALAELLFRNPQAGRLLVGQARHHDVFARRAGFAQAETFVVPGDHGLPQAAVTVARKDVTVAGAAAVAGYVFDLVVDGPARGKGLARQLLDAAERWAHARGAGLLYASIIGGNAPSLTAFRAAGYGVRVPMRLRLFPVFRDRDDRPAPPPAWEGAAALLDQQADRHDLFPPALREAPYAVWSRLPGWRDEDAWVDSDAVLALWDHRAVIHPVPLRLPPELRLLGAVEKVARAARLPFPGAPEQGVPLAMGYLLGGAGAPDALRQALRAALARARTRGLDVVALPHPAVRRPDWAGGALRVSHRYDVVSKRLDAALPPLGARPLWADPVDL